MFLSDRAMEQSKDRTDIAAFLSGRREALDSLVLRYKDRIFNLCCRLLGDAADAEECCQETFIKVFRSLKSFRLESSFSTWLYTIAVNTCRNRRNSADYRFWKRILPIRPNAGEDESSADFDFEDSAPSPLARMAENERNALLQEAINSLPHDQRTVIVLRHIEELSYEEICTITGYNSGTLKSKLARARVQLQKKLQGAYGTYGNGMLSGKKTSF